MLTLSRSTLGLAGMTALLATAVCNISSPTDPAPGIARRIAGVSDRGTAEGVIDAVGGEPIAAPSDLDCPEPPAPTLDPYAAVVTWPSAPVSGLLPLGTFSPMIEIAGPAGTVTARPDRDGRFTIDAPLLPNQANALQISAINACGERSPAGALMITREPCLQPVFAPSKLPEYDTGDGPAAVALGDLDGDGDLDAAVANNTGASVSVLLNNGDGTFAARVDYATGSSPNAVALGDLDGDGDLELAVSSLADRIVSVILNQGDGTFAGRTDWPAGTRSPLDVALADLDGDDDLDMVAVNGLFATGSAVVWANNGSAVFTGPSEFPAGANAVDVAVGDLDGDGDQDLAVAGRIGDSTRVLLNLGDGTFGAPTSYSTSAASSGLELGDLDGDGDLDVVVANTTLPGFMPGDSISILFNFGDGTLGGRIDYPTGYSPQAVALRDLNDDGNLDVVAINGALESAAVSVLLNRGNGILAGRVEYGSVSGPTSLAVGPVDVDAAIDLIVTSSGTQSISVLQNRGDGTFRARAEYPTGGPPTMAAAADLDGDGDLDMTVPNGASGSTTLLFNDGDGRFGSGVDLLTGGQPLAAAVADLDGDGDRDVVVADGNGPSIGVYLNDGRGGLTAAASYPTIDASWSVALGDLDNDGDADLVVANYGYFESLGEMISVRLNDGAGVFSPSTDYFIGSGPFRLDLGDLDGDGDLDVAAACPSLDSISILLNNGDGSFGPRVGYPSGGDPTSVALGDLDADGDLDMAVSNAADSSAAVLRNNGNGTFAPSDPYPITGFPLGLAFIALGDLDGDGDLDMTVATGSISAVEILNNGDGTFGPGVDHATGYASLFVALADLDNDFDLDMVVPSSYGNTVGVLLNRCAP